MSANAFLFDYGGVFTPSPFTAIDALGVKIGAAPGQAMEIIFGPYSQDTDHPWYRLERGEITLAEAREEILAIGRGASLDTDIFADFLTPDVGQIPLANTILDVPATGVPHFGFDLLTSATAPGFGLNLEIDAFTVVFLEGQFSVSATGNASVITEQDLGEFAFDENQPVTIFFGSSQLALTDSGGIVDSFTASGAGHVSGTLVPEPSTVAMLAMGILGLLGAIWRPFVVLLGPACRD